MHCVDAKRGFDGWHRFGSAPEVESPYWQQSLMRTDSGVVVIDLREAVRLSRLHSRVYQSNLETLFISALNVSFERFRFDHQFFGGSGLSSDFRGRDVGQSSLFRIGHFSTNSSFGRVEKLTATGGELVVGFANSLLWDFWGTDSDIFSSAIDFSLVQPLLRGGGRALVLENLTQSERTLLANVRQMQQFQKGFFVDIITGRSSGDGPALRGNIGDGGLGIIAGNPGGRSGAPGAGGFIGLLEDQQEIRNQASNITALKDSLAQLEAAFDANRISSRLQVDQARQALLNAQTSLLISKAAYESRTDSFKVELGLPPDLEVEIQDPLLDRFVLIEPSLNMIQERIAGVLTEIREMRDEPEDDQLQQLEEKLTALAPEIETQLETADEELSRLNTLLPKRYTQLKRVKKIIESKEANVDRRVYAIEELDKSVEAVERRLPEVSDKIELLFSVIGESADEREKQLELTGFDWDDDTSEVKKRWDSSLHIATALSDSLLELSLVQAEIRLQGISLKSTEIDVSTAFEFARLNRLDWMNARANLVDSWRQIEVVANQLKSDLDIVVRGSLGTEPDNILEFDGDNSRIRMGLQFDTPTARLAERNDYRVALINYQRARRNYMLFEDRISQSLRNTLRLLTLTEINLEVRRAAVQVAIAQVDVARLKLNPPVRPNQPSRTSPTAARDLVSALSDLLDAQNDFLNVWVANEVLRILLDFEMGTMQLDPTGAWIDTGDTGETDSAAPPQEPVDFSELLNDPQNQREVLDAATESTTAEG